MEGFVKDQEGNGLAFATIYIRNIESGTTTNEDGFFHIRLEPGKYDFVFQYLGYETLVKFIIVDKQMQKIDKNAHFELEMCGERIAASVYEQTGDLHEALMGASEDWQFDPMVIKMQIGVL